MDEIQFLKDILQKVDKAIHAIDERVNSQLKEIQEAKIYLQEHKRDMDHLEKNAVREAVGHKAALGEASVAKKKRLHRIKSIPYFGRIDFTENQRKQARKIYIGVHNFQDEDSRENLIYDWRAPVSSMFYDFEPGEAWYPGKSKKVKGTITLKRQFRIRDGKMEYMLDTDLTIQDEVLQKELNQATSGKMRNIVASIQREQNAIIRNEEAHNLIIQGVAGSGKTSVALHRIAFLLYKFKDEISAEDILIISPNQVFASYISNVLPELGEEKVAETSMEEIADGLFKGQIKFQGFFDQLAGLLKAGDRKLQERVRFKASPDLLKQMDAYLLHLENHAFKPQDIFINNKPIPAWFIKEKFEQFNRFPLLKRMNEIVRGIVDNVYFYYRYEVKGKERTELHKQVRKMFPSTNLRMLYKGFYNWLERPDLLKLQKGSVYEYADVYPLLYLQMKIEGLPPRHDIKHLIIDEMQDYTPVQYKILHRLFPGKKTILGDTNQVLNLFSASDLETIQSVVSPAVCVQMHKSYRSTWEITEFCNRIGQKSNVMAMERHGKKPEIKSFSQEQAEKMHLVKQLESFQSGSYNSLGVLCKTQEETDALHEFFTQHGLKTHRLNAASVSFTGGIVITTAYLAKGLESDQVIVPFVNRKNYVTETDRQMLYVACTRAMHLLELTHTGEPSLFTAD